jgi:hypothetical protein
MSIHIDDLARKLLDGGVRVIRDDALLQLRRRLL